MNKKQAITALKNGSIMMYYSPIMGLSACAYINNEVIRIDTARELKRTILKMDKKNGCVSYWSIASVACRNEVV
jgi:hypothetical protein